MAQSLSRIKGLLASRGLHPKKRFGQNFLHDHNHLRRILDAAELRPGQVVLEVGAGTGSLSEQLLEAGATLVAVEADRDLLPVLEEVLAPWRERVWLIGEDVLSGKRALNPAVLEALVAAGGPEPVTGYTLVANLPYNVASPLLVNLATRQDPPRMDHAVVMVQKEVADRLVAPPGGGDYGPLGILVQASCTVERVTTLPPSCFWPSPQVASAVVRMRRRDQPLTADLPHFAAVVHALFAQRRKQLGRIFKSQNWPSAAIEPLDPARRPETLSLHELAALAHRLS